MRSEAIDIWCYMCCSTRDNELCLNRRGDSRLSNECLRRLRRDNWSSERDVELIIALDCTVSPFETNLTLYIFIVSVKVPLPRPLLKFLPLPLYWPELLNCWVTWAWLRYNWPVEDSEMVMLELSVKWAFSWGEVICWLARRRGSCERRRLWSSVMVRRPCLMDMAITKLSYSEPRPWSVNNTRSCSDTSDPMLHSWSAIAWNFCRYWVQEEPPFLIVWSLSFNSRILARDWEL
jgi:hypothetical protein